MMACGGISLFAGIIAILISIIHQKWLSILGSFVFVFMTIVSLGMCGFYGYAYFSLVAASDDSMKNKLSSYEMAFSCCGWKTFREYPPCASSVGYSAATTCYDATQKTRGASLQNFIVGAIFLAISILLILLTFFSSCFGSSETEGYNELDEDGDENPDTVNCLKDENDEIASSDANQTIKCNNVEFTLKKLLSVPISSFDGDALFAYKEYCMQEQAIDNPLT
ncbi:Tetraspanin family protein [Entamoeba marina]